MDMNQIGAVMDKFEASFDQADVLSETVAKGMDATTAADSDAVESLLQQVSDDLGPEAAARAFLDVHRHRSPVERHGGRAAEAYAGTAEGTPRS